MKKRALCWMLVLVMVFSLMPFGASAEGTQGVYAVFGEGAAAQPARATYKFVAHGDPYQFNNEKGESTDQQILINGDSLYDVGEPMPNAHETFDGWYVGDQKVEFGTPVTVTASGEVEVVARFTETHTVTFYADAAGTVVLTVKEVAKNASLPIDGLEAPVVSATNDFAYWTDGTNQYAADGTVQNIIDDVELVPVFSTGAWLSFSANGGSYNAPQFFVGGNVAVGANLPVPTRAGYTFAGWYDGNTQVTNEQGSVTSAISIPAEGKTITARWNANNNVPYKVAYWKQNANPNEDNVYEYSLAAEDIVDCQGTAGANADFQSKSFPGFKLNDGKTAAAATTIKGDGTTVRNVYYDRIEYSITFYQRSRTVNITTDFYLYNENGNRISFSRGKHNVSDFDGLYYYDSWGDPHSAVGSNRVYYNYTSWGSRDYASVSISTGSWSVNNDLTITDKYGADIFDQWPSTKYPNSGYPSSWRSGDPDGTYASSCGVMPLNHNYVIDFNGKMTLATGATAMKGNTDKNGAFNVADDVGTYQLKNTEDTFANGANLAFNGIDTALINGVPVGSAPGTTASWEKYTVIPANNVYFDDSLVDASMIAGDDNSIKTAVKANESSPTDAAGNEQGQATLTFTFKGTGIDIYCTTDKDAGWIQANVDGTNYPFVNSRYQESETSTTAIYNTPVISIDGLEPNVEHTLTLRTLTNSNFRLDGIRIYNPMQGVGDAATQEAVNAAYDAANESNAVFLEVRDRILAANKFVYDGASDADIGTITGAVFLETKAEGASIADYTAKGPKEEVYLAPGQAIAFNLGGWSENTYKVMVGLSMPKSTDSTDKTSAKVYASGRGQSNPITVSARTDMFYQIYPDANGNVIIKNNSGGMISVTKLKITTIDPNGTAYEVPAQTTGEAVEPGSRGLQVNRALMSYVMAFDPETEVSPADSVDEPDTPDTPDEPDDTKPGWDDAAFNPANVLKQLFNLLLQSLGSLFGGLGNW